MHMHSTSKLNKRDCKGAQLDRVGRERYFTRRFVADQVVYDLGPLSDGARDIGCRTRRLRVDEHDEPDEINALFMTFTR